MNNSKHTRQYSTQNIQYKKHILYITKIFKKQLEKLKKAQKFLKTSCKQNMFSGINLLKIPKSTFINIY